MDESIYKLFREDYNENWYLDGRARILTHVLNQSRWCPANGRIVDLGAGTGRILSGLTSAARRIGLEDNLELCKQGHQRYGLSFARARLGGRIPLRDSSVDVVTLLDVLEHLDDDLETLIEVRRILDPRGTLFLTVPAFPFLWSRHDDLHGHRRRYRRAQLRRVLRRAGFACRWIGYYNTILFPVVVGSRVLERLLPSWGRGSSDYERVSGTMAALLERIFVFERRFVTRWRFPVGVSLLAVATPAPIMAHP